MRRALALGMVVAVGVVSISLTATQQERVVQVDQLRDNLYVLRGGGGNSAAFVTGDGVVLVDTKLAGWGQPLIDAIGELTSNPVTMIINTHTHFDHVSGNVEFPATVDIVAHENVPGLIDDWNGVTGLGNAPASVFTNGDRGKPTRTFSDRLTLASGAEQIDLYYFGPGHTGGDTWVVFPALRVMHAGDMFAGKGVPIMDKNNGGSGVEYAQTLQNAYRTVTDIDTIITGHSTPMTRADLNEFSEFVGAFVDAARSAKQAGRSAADFAGAWEIPARFSDYGKPPAERLQAYVQVIYDELD